MFISSRTEDGQAYSLQISSLSSLSEFLSNYPLNNYDLQINEARYHLRKTGRCGKRDYPKIALQKDGFILPTELTLTQISDLEYFLREHIGNIYCLEINNSVYQMSR
ncbi:MAG: hypothetical protein KME29_33350 [Calothrix sp. FI2-JRJ7]|jgi:hypothetical protein|nr:hypothetical protein [Calothrix sp. FI2-JRJ7]